MLENTCKLARSQTVTFIAWKEGKTKFKLVVWGGGGQCSGSICDEDLADPGLNLTLGKNHQKLQRASLAKKVQCYIANNCFTHIKDGRKVG